MATYSNLSHLMSEHRDLLILRTFSDLSVKNLLFYQAELAHLEHELEEVEREDQSCENLPRKEHAVNWKSLSMTGDSCVPPSVASTEGQPRDALQWQIFSRVRVVLHDYNNALMQQAKLGQLLSPPHTKNLQTLRKWLNRSEYGNSFLRGRVEGVWDAEKGFNDFAAIQPAKWFSDGPSALLVRLMLHARRRFARHKQPHGQVYSLPEASQAFIANGIMTVISSVFPVLPIVILFFIDSPLVRLGLILVFTALFAAILVFGMRLDPDKVLAITTAFAAVQVVFVGGTTSSSP